MEPLEGRVLVLAPTGKDATLTRAVLGYAGIKCEICADLDCVGRELERGAGALLLAEEAIADGTEPLARIIARQAPWSDLPILMLTRHGAEPDALSEAVRELGNVILLERPLRVAALASAVRSALRARDRQYRARAHLLERDRAVSALEEADRRKDEFLATLAHELRNPLAPIRNSVHILRLTASNDASSSYLFEVMERQVGYMVRLVDDLLEVSRITRGKIELRKERVELSAIIQAAVETTRPLVESARHEMTITLPQEPLYLEADSVRLAQVFANLLNNAAKYTDEGGRIWITAAREDDSAVVMVRDSGIGIPPASLSKVFDMFMQGDATKTRGGGGLGIGLTLARTLAGMHGGSVSARSEGPGKGSEFVVRLPLAKDAQPSLPELAGAPQAVPGPTRVLVVDDSRDGADSLRLLLELLGAEVRVEYDGPAALDAFGAYQPEVVLLDIGMPGMDGFEVARRLRQRPESQDVTLIALTGWGQEKDRRNSEAAGFDHHLVKPVDIDALQGLLTAVHSADA